MRNIILIALTFAVTTLHAQNATIEKYDLDSELISTPRKLTVTNNKLYFLANTKSEGQEIWSADNAFAPERVTDIQQGPLDGISQNNITSNAMGVLGNKLFFVGKPANYSYALFAYDSQTDITSIIDTTIGYVSGYLTYNNKLYFNCIKDFVKGLYQYDPSTKAVTLLVKHTDPSYPLSQVPPVAANNHIYYLSQEKATHITLHDYNINTNTDVIIGDKTPALASLQGIWHLTVANNNLYFSGQTINYGFELYKYDGINPVQRLTDIGPGKENGVSSEISVYKNRLYFFGNANNPNDPNATQLYSYDITTQQLTKLPNAIPNGFNNSTLTEYNNKLYYKAKAQQYTSMLCAYNPNTDVGYIMPSKANNATGDVLPATNLVRLNNVLFFGAQYKEPDDKYGKAVLAKITDAGLSIAITAIGVEAKLYPNPTTGNTTIAMTLENSQTIAVQITDVSGRVVYSKPATQYNSGKHLVQIPTHALASGTYIYKLVDDKGTAISTGKLMKE